MLPQPADLKYFLETFETENISRAAERLGITQPSLSLSIKRLETNLGVKLFLRSKTGVKPTKQAIFLASRAQQLLNQWSELKLDAKQSTEKASGHLKLGIHPSVGMYALTPWLRKFSTDFPDIELSLIHDLSRKVTEQIISFNIDLAIAVNPIHHPDLVIQELCQDEVNFYKSKNSLNNILIYDGNLSQSQSLILKNKNFCKTYTKHITTESLELVGQLTSDGIGQGILPGRVANLFKNLKVTNDKIKAYKDKICLIYRADYPKTKAFSVLKNTIAKGVKN